MADSIQSSVFYGSWSSRYYAFPFRIHGSCKIEFGSDPTRLKLYLTCPDTFFNLRNMRYELDLKLSRNEWMCYGQSDDQTFFIKIDLMESNPCRVYYLSTYPYYDDGFIRSDNNICNFIIKNIPNTLAEEPALIKEYHLTGNYDCYADVGCEII